MEDGVVECTNGHRVCARCTVNSAPRHFGIRDLVLKSSLDQVLNWSGLACRICGVRGPSRRSVVTEEAVAALPVRCGFTAPVGGTCRWIGRRDEFHAHRHAFASDQLEPRPSGRGIKRSGSAPNDVDQERAKQRRFSVEAKSDNGTAQFQTAKTTSSNTVPLPDISAAGEWATDLVATGKKYKLVDGSDKASCC